MSISRVEIQGQVTRAQDFTTIKQNENNKSFVDQTNFQKQFDRTIDNRLRQVHEGDRAENEGKRFDAKDKGNGSYSGDGGKGRKKEEKERDGRVVLKGSSNFDVKI